MLPEGVYGYAVRFLVGRGGGEVQSKTCGSSHALALGASKRGWEPA